MPNHALSHLFVYVRDQDEALAFYTGPVGLEVRSDADLGSMRWLTVGPPSQPAIEINLQAIGPPLAPADHDSILELVTKGSMPTVIFTTDDCDATYARLRDAGVEMTQEPVDQQYGVRDCACRDPSGNMLRFSEHPVAR